ncbi:hypothetical protein SDC9_53074 [bioreactor metagenome]|uniref:Uncharacterized protein n=1 Tax=bioreactor metagenome TaxID=1076179 RepID=A0A644WTA7_9ZZZZ
MNKAFLSIVLICLSIYLIISRSNEMYTATDMENGSINHSEPIQVNIAYKNKQNNDILVANSDGTFVLYKSNKNYVKAIGGNWSNNVFIIDFEYAECPDSKYTFIRKGTEHALNSFTFNNDEWVKDEKLSTKEIYEEKINIGETINHRGEFTIVDYGLNDEEILTNSVLQFGGPTLGATYSKILIFFEDNSFKYYGSGYGYDTKEDAEEYNNRINYLSGNWKIENNQILFEINESEIKCGGHAEYDVISGFILADYELTNELNGTNSTVNFEVHIDEIDPRYKSYIEINEDKYYFMSGYKYYNNKDYIDIFIKNINY